MVFFWNYLARRFFVFGAARSATGVTAAATAPPADPR
jgi:hypothetical protein